MSASARRQRKAHSTKLMSDARELANDLRNERDLNAYNTEAGFQFGKSLVVNNEIKYLKSL